MSCLTGQRDWATPLSFKAEKRKRALHNSYTYRLRKKNTKKMYIKAHGQHSDDGIKILERIIIILQLNLILTDVVGDLVISNAGQSHSSGTEANIHWDTFQVGTLFSHSFINWYCRRQYYYRSSLFLFSFTCVFSGSCDELAEGKFSVELTDRPPTTIHTYTPCLHLFQIKRRCIISRREKCARPSWRRQCFHVRMNG